MEFTVVGHEVDDLWCFKAYPLFRVTARVA